MATDDESTWRPQTNPMFSGQDDERTWQSTVPVAQAVTSGSGDIESGNLPLASHKVSRLVRPSHNLSTTLPVNNGTCYGPILPSNPSLRWEIGGRLEGN
jgi:hypothetical protein